MYVCMCMYMFRFYLYFYDWRSIRVLICMLYVCMYVCMYVGGRYVEKKYPNLYRTLFG